MHLKSPEIVDCLSTEFANLKSTSVTDLYIAIRGLNKCMIQDIFMVRPAINLFDEIYTENDWVRARIGDVSSNDPSGIFSAIHSVKKLKKAFSFLQRLNLPGQIQAPLPT